MGSTVLDKAQGSGETARARSRQARIGASTAPPARRRALCALVMLAAGCTVDSRTPITSEAEPDDERESNLPFAPDMRGDAPEGSSAPGGGDQGSPGDVQGGGGSTASEESTTPVRDDESGPAVPEAISEPADNAFGQVLGVSAAEVDRKLRLAAERIFGIGTNEANTPTQRSGFRLYYELPQDPFRGFIWAGDSEDVRSEGIGYGLLIAVQMGLRDQFDRLWNFVQAYAQYAPNDAVTAWRHYFRWQGTLDMSSPLAWTVNFPSNTAPNPRADTCIAAALYLADRRWGSGDSVNYQREADAISTALLNNPASAGRTPAVDAATQLVVFSPVGAGAGYANTGHQLPAFYELFAADGPPSESERWRQVAQASRQLLVSSAHPTTGLHPDYVNFDGTPNAALGAARFGFEAWPVVLNMAVDAAWFGSDPRLPAQIARYHAFFANDAASGSLQNSVFALDGSSPSNGVSTGLAAALAAGASTSMAPNRADYVRLLWDLPQRSGLYRHYDELLYVLGLLTTGGRFDFEGLDAVP